MKSIFRLLLAVFTLESGTSKAQDMGIEIRCNKWEHSGYRTYFNFESTASIKENTVTILRTIHYFFLNEYSKSQVLWQAEIDKSRSKSIDDGKYIEIALSRIKASFGNGQNFEFTNGTLKLENGVLKLDPYPREEGVKVDEENCRIARVRP